MEKVEAKGIEDRIRDHHGAGEYAMAATTAIEAYGPELLGFLVALLHDEGEGREVFADLCAELWTGIERFQLRSSFRSWAYAVARHLLSHRHRARRGLLPLSEVSRLSQLEAKVRTATPLPYRSEVRELVDRLRAQLTAEEQTLLILRVDRGLPWRDVAMIMLGPEGMTDDAAVRREAAACRKRYERLTDRLRRLVEAEGLLDDEGPDGR